MYAGLMRLWRGEMGLGRAFWDFGIIYGSLLNLATTAAAFAALAAKLPAALVLALYLLALPYNVSVVVGVWRSADRYQGDPGWAHAARLGIIAWAVAATIL